MALIRTGLLHIPVFDPETGEVIRRLLHSSASGVVVMQEGYAGQRLWIEEMLRRWCDEEELDLVLTLGGTLPAPGPSGREPTPEATLAVVERLLPGLPEAMRAYAQDETPLALLDRGIAGIRGRSLILNLPGGAGAAVRFLEPVVEVLPAVLAHLQDDPAAPTLAAALKPERDSDEIDNTANADPSPRSGLNADDFAAFLARRKQGDSPVSDEPDPPVIPNPPG
jgi:molybdopterin biosynthesis enzyme MoaB